MSDQPGFFARIGRKFGSNKVNGDLPLPDSAGEIDLGSNDHNGNGHADEADASHDDAINGHTQLLVQPGDGARGSFLRPWAKRDAAITQLQDGFTALNDLMGDVKDALDRQTAKQEELMHALSTLPEVLRTIPQNSQTQTQTLKAMAEQLKHQNAQQAKLGDILEKVSESDGSQKQILENLKGQVESLGDHDRHFADHLNHVGAAMQGVSRNSSTSAQVLEQMRDNMSNREGELQRILRKQGRRYTAMLSIAIFLSVAAIAAATVVGYLMMNKMR